MPRDDAELAKRMVDHLRQRGAVREQELAAAAKHFEAGSLPSTALRLAGVDRGVVLDALSAASGLPPAPPAARWTSDALDLTPLTDISWARIRAVPIGVVDGRVQVAFAEPQRVAAASDTLPTHDALCCLEEDLEAALRALVAGGTVFGHEPARTELDGAEGAVTTPVPAGGHEGLRAGAGGLSPEGHAVAASGRALPIDPTTVGAWHIDRRLAAGGMGVVYLAHDDAGRRAAVKLVHAHLLHVAIVRQRFLREAQATRRLQHENIVAVLDIGEGDPAWLAVEFVEGGSLFDLLRTGGRLPLAAALDLVVQLLSGLVVAHGQGIVHRDLKPANLLFSPEGVVKIVDFGIARELDATALTQTGSTLGTPAYMSPEQALADPIDGRSDVYAVGVIAHEVLLGKNPFDGDSLGAIVNKILRGGAARLFDVDAAIPEAVDDYVAWLLELRPEGRPASAAEALVHARALFDEARRGRARPLGDLLRDPRQAEQMRREQADDLVTRAKTLLHKGPALREAAGLSLHRAILLAPDHAEAAALLAGLSGAGVRFGAPGPKLVELMRELAHNPADPVLLQRAGHLARQEGNVHAAAVYWRRSLRARPDDAYVQGQLARVTGVDAMGSDAVEGATPATPAAIPAAVTMPLPAAASPGATVARIAGHIQTAGLIGAPPAAVPMASAPSLGPGPALAQPAAASAGLDQVRAAFSVHGGKLIAFAVVIAVVGVGVRGARSCVGGAQKQIDAAAHGHTEKPAASDDGQANSDHDLRVAEEALASGNADDAEKRASAGLERGADHSTTAQLYLARGKARIELRRPLAAVEDLSRVIEDFRDVDSAAPRALLTRGIAHARSGDAARARADFTACIDGRANPQLVAEARFERGKIESAAGDAAGARADFQWARDYLPPGDPVSTAAKAALAALP